jgi:hypothetical protein
MLLKLTASIPLLENLSLKTWHQDEGGISVICGGLKSLSWATSMIIKFILYSAVEKSKYGLSLACSNNVFKVFKGTEYGLVRM